MSVPFAGSPLRLVRSGSIQQLLASDRIARGLLQGQVVSYQEIYSAWAHQQDYQDGRPFWRILSDVHGTNSSQLFRLVALYYSFQEADVSALGTQTLVTQNSRRFTPREWRRMVELGVFPIRLKNDTLDDGVRWTFASFDPTRLAVRDFVQSVTGGPARLTFLAPAVLFDIVSRCTGFPKLDALPWYRKYVLGRLPVALRPLPGGGDVRRAA